MADSMAEPPPGAPGTLAGDAGTALRASERHPEIAEQAAGVVVFDWDLAADRITASPEIYRLHGVAPGTSPTSEAWLATIHPDDRASIQAGIAALTNAAHGGPALASDAAENEYRVVSGGAVRWIASRVRVVHGADGRPARVLGVDIDLTERQRVEAALRESEAHYRFRVELNPQIPWTADPDGRVLDFSQRWLHLTGLTREGTLGEGWRWAVHPDDLPHVTAAWGHSVQTGEPYDHEYRTRLADGSYRWVRVRAFPRRDEQGRIVRWYGTTDDVHDRRSTEAALRASEERFRLATEALAGFLYDWELGTNRVARFGGMDALVGFRPDEVPSNVAWWQSRVHPDDLAVVAGVARAALDAGAPGYAVEYRVRHRDGHYVDVTDHARIVCDAAGRAVRAVGGTSDISERRCLERERVALLEREREAHARADAANRAKGELLARMSHELRTPLNAILGHVQVMEMGVHGPVTAAQRDALARISRAQRHLLTLIDDILQFATLEAGRARLELGDVSLEELREQLEVLVHQAIAAKGLAYTCDVRDPAAPGGMPLVARGDRDRVLQILVNLVMNAVKYTGDGGTVAVDAVADAEHVYVRVRDTGRGIPADQCETIFQPFVQCDQRTGREGVGLGLAISRDLAHLMGGDVTVESAVGVGSTFTLTLDRATAGG